MIGYLALRCGRRTEHPSVHYGLLAFWSCPGMHFAPARVNFLAALLARALAFLNILLAAAAVLFCAALVRAAAGPG